MRYLFVLILVSSLLGSSNSSPVTHFRPFKKSQLPESFFQYLCRETKGQTERKVCIQNFIRTGSAWAGDVNNDGVDEFIVDAGDVPGTEGPSWEVIQLRGKNWVSLACLDPNEGCEPLWNSLHARFDILPITRHGYHDLRIEVDRCLKWDGHYYVEYDDSDYPRLNKVWFDVNDSREAELFWKIQYSGEDVIQFRPLWFPVSQEEFSRPVQHYMGLPVRVIEFPKLTCESLSDLDQGVNWVSFCRAGVWGVRGDHAFLLVPRPSYLGASRLELRGDSLYIYGEVNEETDAQPTIIYNRRTGELRYQREDDH
jgi:hypothetical protein